MTDDEVKALRCAYRTDDGRYGCPKRAVRGGMCKRHAAQDASRRSVAEHDQRQRMMERQRTLDALARYRGDFP